MAVQMQKILQQRGWVQKTGKNMQKSDRGSVAKSGDRTAGLRGTGADRSRLSGRQKRPDRREGAGSHGRVAARGLKVAVETQENGRQAQPDHRKQAD